MLQRWRTMKFLSCLILMLCLSGCAAFDILLAIFPPEPYPVCDADSAGTEWNGKVCLKYSDGSYQWTEIKK